MRRALLALMIMTATIGCAAEQLPELDKTKPLYQKRWGLGFPAIFPIGGVKKVRMPDPKTIAELKEELEMQDLRHKQAIKEKEREHKEREHNFGSWCKRIGWLLLALGFAGHFCSSFGPVKSASSSVMTLGVVAIVAGLGIQKTVEHETILTLVIIVPLGGFALYKARNWSVSHLLKRKKEEEQEES